nr:zinc finger FYVE domain-containing protein 26-like [Oncorhynchus nerka]
MRHDNMKDALQHLLSKECPEEVFLEGVLQPSLERGRLGMLQGLLETLDPGLEVCSRYLLSSCQLLQRRGHFHTLYQLQQFMMVSLYSSHHPHYSSSHYTSYNSS